MSTKPKSVDQIGAELVSAAKSQTQDSLPLSTRLFPYVYIASRRMSLRTISTWLEDNYKVSLSAGSISRALNQPEMHLERLADFIAPVAQYVAKAYGCDPMNLLFDRITENGPSVLHNLVNHDFPKPDSLEDVPRWDELQYLASLWEPIPHEVELLLEPFLRERLQFNEPQLSNDDQF